MGWHRNHAISHSPNKIFFEDTLVSHSGGPNEQFGTHEKLSWGVQGNLNWMPGYKVAVCLPVIGVSLEVFSILKHLCDFVSAHFEFE